MRFFDEMREFFFYCADLNVMMQQSQYANCSSSAAALMLMLMSLTVSQHMRERQMEREILLCLMSGFRLQDRGSLF